MGSSQYPEDMELGDECLAHWLDLLRDGTPAQRAQARTELGLILERRGQEADAIEAYWTNVRLRAEDPRPYDRLIAIFQKHNDVERQARVQIVRDSVFAAVPPARPGADRRLLSAQHRWGLIGVSLLVVAILVAVSWYLLIAVTGAGVRTHARRLMTPDKAARSLSAIDPLSASINYGQVEVVESLFWQAPAWCADVAHRFPEWNDREAVVKRAADDLYFDLSGTRHPVGNPAGDMVLRSYLLPPDQGVAGWILAAIYSTHFHEEIASLKQYVRFQSQWRTLPPTRPLPGVVAIVNEEQWQQLMALPENSCDGRFLRNPANLPLVQRMRESVGDTSHLMTGR